MNLAPPIDQNQHEILDYKQAAAFLSLPMGTIYAMVSQRRLPHFRIGPRCVRFKRQELLSWLEAKHVSVPQ